MPDLSPEPEPNCDDQDHPQAAATPLELAICQRAADLFRALSDPQRLRLLNLLMNAELCVTALAKQLQEPPPAVSQRLRILRSERIVDSRRDGKHVYYSLTDDHVAQLVKNSIDHVRE